MHSPFLIARFVLFSILMYLNILALGFAAWEISSMMSSGLSVPGSPIFVIFNACVLFFMMILAGAELVFPNARTAQVKFECGWTAFMSALQLASAIDVTINGPPVYCGLQPYQTICAASTVLMAVTWISSILVLAYFLALCYLAISHSSIYGGIWTTTVYRAPWFIEPSIPNRATKLPPRTTPLKEPYENPAFSAHEDEADVGESGTWAPPRAPFAGYAAGTDIESLSHPSPRFLDASIRSRSEESLRPQWAKRVNTRRGVDAPFAPLPVAQRVSRLIKSCWSPATTTAPPSPPPKPRLPAPAHLDGGFLDCHRNSYGFFPAGVDDVDEPIRQTRMSEWVQARR